MFAGFQVCGRGRGSLNTGVWAETFAVEGGLARGGRKGERTAGGLQKESERYEVVTQQSILFIQSSVKMGGVGNGKDRIRTKDLLNGSCGKQQQRRN
jgi:hypothetical protein